MSQQSDKIIIEKQKIMNAMKGCKDNLCLSKHCRNYIKSTPFMIELRKDKKNLLKYVLANLKTGELEVNCALPKQKVELIEEINEYQELFDLNFQEILNMNSSEQERKFVSLESIINKLENEIETNSREKILKHLDRALENQFKIITSFINEEVKNLQFFVTLTKLLICFKNFFTLENFVILENFNKFLSSLKFHNIYDHNFNKFSQRTLSLDKEQILLLIENIQNTITCTKYFVDEITLLTINQQDSLVNCFQTLEFFYHVNKQNFYQEKIDISEFQNDDILTNKEYHLEVIRLIIRTSKENDIELPLQLTGEVLLRDDFSFLNWSFFYSAAQKVDLLHYESKILQQFEMQSSIQNLMQNPMLLLQNGVTGIYLELNLDRNTILEDTLNQLHYKGKGNNLKKTLRIKFKGEPGVDEGGLTKEFFQILIDKLFDPNFGMFETKNNNRFMWFNKNSFECNLNFELIGMLLGLALYNATILKLNFPLAIYKKLKNVELDASGKKLNYIKPQIIEDKITLEDLQEFEPELYVSFSNLLKNDFTNQSTGFNFQVTYLSWGQTIDHDLIENGSEIEVTQENKQQFIDEYLNWYFKDSIKKQFEPFAVGFHKVLTGELIKIFSANDLFLSICGSETLDFNELKRTTKYEDGYKQDSVTIQHFWKILLNDFDQNQQKNFLKFLTGSDRAPLRGLSDIKLVISRQGNGDQLPAAHTCFNHLLLPDYQDYEKLKEKLVKSIQHFEGFGLF